MSETVQAALAWVIPAVVVFGVSGVLGALAIWSLRRARTSPRARTAAEADRTAAGSVLVRLDDAVDELDLEVGLSGALYDGTAPAALRRARMTAQHTRDAAFEQFRGLDSATHPDEVRRVARQIRSRAEAAIAAIDRARAEHADWMSANVTAAAQVAAAQQHADEIRRELGNPRALLADLSGRVDASETEDARRAADQALNALAEADRILAEAAQLAADPTRTALPKLSAAERELRRAQSAARTLEEEHHGIIDAARAVGDEIEVTRAALRQGLDMRAHLEADAAARLGAELREIDGALSALEPHAARRPTATVDAIVRLRDRLDLALGDARTAQQRLRGARTALPGTLAAARTAVARAEASASAAGADARVRLASAQQELASARAATDPVEALDAARRAMRHAEDAVALADYDRLTGRRS